MSEKKGAFEDELATLRTLRDELRVQVNLAAKDARDLFTQAEKGWDRLEGKAGLLKKESSAALLDVGEAARLVVSEIQEAYRHIRRLL
jgi:hypothetical protein